MNRRILSILTAMMLCMSLLAGCTRKEEPAGEEENIQTEEESTVEGTAGSVSADDDRINAETLSTFTYLTEEMYADADCFSEGDTSRILAAMQKAAAGESVTVAVIGGSITQGTAASSTDKSYAGWFKKWWELSFPDAEINFVNAGIGATTSYLGVHRVEEDLLKYEPDMVIVEFSVNDADTAFYKTSYDNLVRRILKSENMPAVLLLFTTQENGTSAALSHGSIGFKYSLPMLSYGNCVLNRIEAGDFVWTDISPDNIHPNDRGHAIIGEILWHYLNDLYLAGKDALPVVKEEFRTASVTKELYQEATILYNDDIEPVSYGSFGKADVNYTLPGNWTTSTGDEALIFEVEATNIGIMYQKTTDGLSGQFEIVIDGVSVTTLNGDFSGGWGNYAETQEVYRGEERMTHTLEIRRSDNSTGGQFSVLGLLIS